MADEKIADYRLLSACYKVDVVEVQRLLPHVKNPANVRDSSVWPKTLLHYSCRYNWLDVTRRLVEQYHCDLESRDKLGDTPLHEACREGHVDIVRYLVGEQRCSITCQNEDGDTPIHVACFQKCLAMVEIFLASKNFCAASKLQNNNGKTLLHYSCCHGWLDVTRKLVEQYHCDPGSRDKLGWRYSTV